MFIRRAYDSMIFLAGAAPLLVISRVGWSCSRPVTASWRRGRG